MSHVVAIAPPWPVANWPRLITISIAALMAIGFFVNTALPYLCSIRRRSRVMGRDARGCLRILPVVVSRC